MFWYNFIWLIGTYNYPVNYWNPYLNDLTNNIGMIAFFITWTHPLEMFNVEIDLPFDR